MGIYHCKYWVRTKRPSKCELSVLADYVTFVHTAPPTDWVIRRISPTDTVLSFWNVVLASFMNLITWRKKGTENCGRISRTDQFSSFCLLMEGTIKVKHLFADLLPDKPCGRVASRARLLEGVVVLNYTLQWWVSWLRHLWRAQRSARVLRNCIFGGLRTGACWKSNARFSKASGLPWDVCIGPEASCCRRLLYFCLVPLGNCVKGLNCKMCS